GNEALALGQGLTFVAKTEHGVRAKLDGDRDVLILEGTPKEMGTAHGRLMKSEIGSTRARIYTAGVAASLVKGESFIALTDEAIRRTRPYVPKRFYEEMDALAESLGYETQDVYRLNNFMELFHCSGVAIRGPASKDGRVLHARVLDYARDIGLQDSSTIIVFMPKDQYAWISVTYSGFCGTVTAMNEKGLAIGEMGGGGEGKWDGLPMAFMMRRVVEECSTVDEALELMKSVPLTCDYYYVLSDAQGNLAAVQAIAESKEPVVVLRPGEECEQWPGALDDVVYVSAGSRAVALFEQLKENYGKIDVEKMQEMIKRPVAMNSNLHDAIFAPETRDLWHAEAGKSTPACDEPYLRINLFEAVDFYKKHIE
ncbi:MAG: hypothetical protein J6X44_11185, partial [Thermoguttaceae bacterium]|nr:hypothetical protein [Thermoguttaceae bacterium]